MAHRDRVNATVHGRRSTFGNSTERRLRTRGSPEGEPPRSRLVAMIEGTYREMPGLTLNVIEAARLFGLRERTCRVVLDDLVRQERLRRTPAGQYRAR